MINQKNTSLLMFFPRFLKSLKDIINLSKTTDIKINQLLNKFDSLERMKKISEGNLTDDEIEALLYEKHVDYFDKDLTSAQKIQLIQSSEEAHLKKGTRATMDKLLTIIFGDLELQEWFEYESEPNHFRILTDSNISQDTIVKINKTAEEFKTLRSVFDGIIIKQKEQIDFSFVIATHEISFESEARIGLQNDRINSFGGILMHDISIENEKIIN